MNIQEMHSAFRIIGQQMGIQLNRGILPETIDVFINSVIVEKTQMELLTSIKTVFQEKIDTQPSTMSPINLFRNLYKTTRFNVNDYAMFDLLGKCTIYIALNDNLPKAFVIFIDKVKSDIKSYNLNRGFAEIFIPTIKYKHNKIYKDIVAIKNELIDDGRPLEMLDRDYTFVEAGKQTIKDNWANSSTNLEKIYIVDTANCINPSTDWSKCIITNYDAQDYNTGHIKGSLCLGNALYRYLMSNNLDEDIASNILDYNYFNNYVTITNFTYINPMMYLGISVEYKQDKQELGYPVACRLLGADMIETTMRDFCNAATKDAPISCILSEIPVKDGCETDTEADSGLEYMQFYTNTKNLQIGTINIKYIKMPNVVHYDIDINNCVNCDLPSYCHFEIVDRAVRKFYISMGYGSGDNDNDNRSNRNVR